MVRITVRNLQKRVFAYPQKTRKSPSAISWRTMVWLPLAKAITLSDFRSGTGKYKILSCTIKKLISKALKEEGVEKEGEITICFANDTLIRKLNARYLKKNKPTDVLTFDLTNFQDKRQLFADIIISTDTAIRNARVFKTAPLYELSLYSIHGLLHLLGYDDHSEESRKIMRGKELKYVHT